MKKLLPSLTLLLLCSSIALAQQAPAAPQASTQQQQPGPAAPAARLVEVDSVQVTTTVEPLPFAESDRSVEMLRPREMPIGTDSVIDLLRTD